MKYFQRGGGYYIDVGCSTLIASGAIAVKQGQEITQVTPDGLDFTDGTKLPADEIVFATGFDNMRATARRIFGDELANRVKDVWGFDKEGELRTMWRYAYTSFFSLFYFSSFLFFPFFFSPLFYPFSRRQSFSSQK